MDGRGNEDQKWVERAKEFGIDISLIEDNLRLTPEQRMMRNDILITEIERFRCTASSP